MIEPLSAQHLTRRGFLASSLSLALSPGLLGCSLAPTSPSGERGDPRLTARPGIPSGLPSPGQSNLDLGGSRDGFLFVPPNYDPELEYPLFIALHGAGGSAAGMSGFGSAADSRDVVVLIPDSRHRTWDVVMGGFGDDVAFLDRALAQTFDRCRIDPMRICLSGFSDGASYAASLGLPNGDLFTHIVAFSPGFMVPPDPAVGSPRCFISHGRQDPILPVTQSRDQIVPWLREHGYDVHYEEFDGGHTVPGAIATQALDWFLA
jgi:phospholipase/carboxylesterase